MRNENIWTTCNECRKNTNQELLYSTDKEEKYIVEGFETKKNIKYKLIKCKGCGFIALQIIESVDSDRDENDKPIEYSYTYPEEEDYYDDYRFLKYDELDLMPSSIQKVYEEVTDAIENYSYVLASVGLRMLIEAICKEKETKGKSLISKIDGLFKDGYIAKTELPILQKIREIGNKGAHEIEKPSESVLNNAIEIINHLLRGVYVIPKKGQKVS